MPCNGGSCGAAASVQLHPSRLVSQYMLRGSTLVQSGRGDSPSLLTHIVNLVSHLFNGIGTLPDS